MPFWELSLLTRRRKHQAALIPDKTKKLADLTKFARKLGLEHQQVFFRNNRSTKQMIERFRDNNRQISRGIKRLSYKKKHQSLTPTEKWLLENKAIILGTAENVSLALTQQLLSRLPNLKSNPSKIRVFEIIINLISHSDHHLNYHRIKKFILDYQSETPLTVAELWAIPLVAQAVILDSISNIEDEVVVKNIILGLRNIHKIDWNDFVEDLSSMEKILRRDPAGVYPLMDFRTRDTYRHNIEEVHFLTGYDQNELASWVVNQARKFQPKPDVYSKNHIGYYLLGPGRVELEKVFIPKRKLLDNFFLLLHQRPVKIYFLALWGTTLLFFYLCSLLQIAGGLWLLTIFPSFYISNLFTHLAMVHLYLPSILPKMNPDLPVGEKNRTLVLVPTIIPSDPKEQADLLAKLEENFSNNCDPNIFFAVALAWPETTHPGGQPTREESDALESLKRDLSVLNRKHPHPHDYFHLFFRKRLWSPDQQNFVEWERKRGKVIEFVRLLRGATDTTFSFSTAKPEFLLTIKYVITLDDDITAPRDTAKKLIATISHPLNRPVIDEKRQVVTAGYGIIQPRISTQIPLANKTFADYVFSGDSGWDSYSLVASSTYQDVFRESFFLGRGIFDVEVFNQILSRRFPEDTLLSHDHIEGFYCRTGFACDIQIFETYPKSYFSYSSRLHRWIRGDWQRLFWLLGHVKNQDGKIIENPLHFFQRWKLADDMIQNLILPATLLLSLMVAQPLGLFFLLTVILIQPLVSFIQSIPIQKNLLRAWRHFFLIISENFRTFLAKFFFNLIFAFHLSLVICHAIVTALTRILITKRKRLEWAIFLQTNTKGNNSLINNLRQTLPAELILITVLFLSRFSTIPTILSFIWLSTPLFASLLGLVVKPKPVFSKDEEQHLRVIARQTWRFFDDLVNSAGHFLPPDHFQQTTPVPISTRTSATDIGLYLTSMVSALDLGFVSAQELLDRSSKTLSTMARLETLNGHFFNWYDTKSLKALPPGYVSTVDSGNLACGFVILHQALKNLSDASLVSQKVKNTIDDLFLLANVRKEFPQPPTNTLTEWYNFLTTTAGKLKHLETSYWLTKTIQYLESQAKQLIFFAPWVNQPGFKNPLLDRCRTLSELEEQYVRLKNLRDIARIDRFRKESDKLSRQSLSFAMDMDFSFLYDSKQNLFHIGYSLSRRSFDQGHYDLLASEARTASLFAIAKYDVPLKHWSSLSRPLSLYHHRSVLLSWGGSIFEYLLPNLFLPRFPQTLLWETYQTIIKGHIDYGKANKIPWGISESSYGLVNKDGHYRYKLHGIPDFGLKQFPLKDLVISPYSVFLAMEFVPQEAYKNIVRLEAQGLSGRFGLYEAIDYTNYEPNKLNDRIIRTFFCHHQGIILAAIANQLENFSIRARFSSFEPILAHLTLLQEKIPINVSFTTPQTPPETDTSEELAIVPESSVTQTFTAKSVHSAPQFNLLSNGRYKVFLSDHGTGFSAYRGTQLIRDLYVFLRDTATQNIWSAGLVPGTFPPEGYEVSSTQDTTRITRRNWEIETSLETTVLHNDDVEIRLLRLTNNSSKKRQLEVTFYSEIVLNSFESDQAHPAFSKMRLESELIENSGPILLFSRQTAPNTDSPQIACRLTSNSLFGKILVETDRRMFLGRTGNFDRPLIITTPKAAHHVPRFSLDPIACFQTKVTLEPKATTDLCFVQTIAASKETVLANITNYGSIDRIKEIIDLARARGVPGPFASISHKTIEQLLACLLQSDGQSFLKKPVRPEIDPQIDWSLPVITILAGPSTHPNFLHQSLNLCYFLAYQGLPFKVVLLAYDRDNYYQDTFNLVQDTVNYFETLVANNNLVSPSINILRSHDLSGAAIKFICGASSVILDPNKSSTVATQINLAFKRL